MAKLPNGISMHVKPAEMKKFEKAMLEALANEINAKLPKVALKSSKQIKNNFYAAIMKQNTVQSLIGGELRGEFGMNDSLSRIQKAIEVWVDSLVIVPKTVKVGAGGISGGFTIMMVKSNWVDVLSTAVNPDAVFVTPKNAYRLEWLKWLLIEGGRIVVTDYDFVKKGGFGRTGQGYMSSSPRLGRRRWHVPTAYQGTSENNFAIDAVNEVILGMETIIKTELAGAF